MSKHTTWPWRADSYDPMHIVADMPNGRDVVLVCRVDTNTYKDMGRRNRDLILAAPDLLEALEPFAHPDLCAEMGGNVEGDNSPIYARNGALLRLGDFRRAAMAVTKAIGRNK